jgi:hypothetical protein
MGQVKGQWLSAKIMRHYEWGDNAVYAHWCPACKQLHAFYVDAPTHKGARWFYNLNHDNPTFQPSMNISWGSPDDEEGVHGRCHYFITNGMISYCGDSLHELAGQTIELPDIPRQQWLYVGVIPEDINRI